MKIMYLLICVLVAAVIIVAFQWTINGIDREVKQERTTKLQLPSSQLQSRLEPTGESTASPATIVMAQVANGPEVPPDEATKVWLDAHRGRASVQQEFSIPHEEPHRLLQEPHGKIAIGNARGGLGEDPPRIRYVLQTSQRPILIGDKDEQRRFIRSVQSVMQTGDNLQVRSEVTVFFPRGATSGGFVFRRQQQAITEMGVVVPEVSIPKGDNPDMEQYAVTVRLEHPFREITGAELLKIPVQPIDESLIVLMKTHEQNPLKSARILWLRLGADDSFERGK